MTKSADSYKQASTERGERVGQKKHQSKKKKQLQEEESSTITIDEEEVKE
jgi:hypothetical protein